MDLYDSFYTGSTNGSPCTIRFDNLMYSDELDWSEESPSLDSESENELRTIAMGRNPDKLVYRDDFDVYMDTSFEKDFVNYYYRQTLEELFDERGCGFDDTDYEDDFFSDDEDWSWMM